LLSILKDLDDPEFILGKPTPTRLKLSA